MGDGPRVVIIAFPLPNKVQCPRCYRGEEAFERVRGEYCDPAHLAKHLKQMHPGDTIAYECSVCAYRGKTAYPKKDVAKHYDAQHSVPRTEPGPALGTGARPRQSSAQATRAATTASARSRTQRAQSREPTTAVRGRASPTGSTTSRSSAGSPTYAAVTAATTRTTRGASMESSAQRTAAAGRLALRRPAPAAQRTTPPLAGWSGVPEAATKAPTTTAARPAARPVRPPARATPSPTGTSSASSAGGVRRSAERTPPLATTAREAAPSASRRMTRSVSRQNLRRLPSTTPSPPSTTGSSVQRRTSTTARRAVTVSPTSNTRRTTRTVGSQTPPLEVPNEPRVSPEIAVNRVAAMGALTHVVVTMTTTASCRPIMATGLPAVIEESPAPRLATTPPPAVSAVPAIISGSPAYAPRITPSRAIEDRTPVAAATTPPSSPSDGDSGSWRRPGGRRRAKRRRLNSDDETPSAPAAPAAIVREPVALANAYDLISDIENILATPEERRGEATLLTAREGGDTPVSTGVGNANHPSARVGVRGVMGRQRNPATRVQAAEENGAPAVHAAPGGSGANQRRPQRPAAQPDQSPRRRPTPAAVERQRRRARLAARDALVGRAAAVETIADLEEFAALVAAFFGEDAASRAGVETSGARDRPRGAGRPRGRRAAEAVAVGHGDAGGEAPAEPPLNNQSGEGRRNWVREATRIQALYRRNRRKAVREVLQGPADFCQVPKQRVHQYFERLYCGEGRLDDAGADVEPAEPATPDDVARLAAPFTEREVTERLRRVTNSAPGPDGITYNDLRAADPQARLLTSIFNLCVRLEAVPASWKTSNTILVYKKGDREDLNNWRPLALGDTMPKLFAALLADRLTDWAVAKEKLSPAQKGFLRDEGCYEHNFVLQEILTDARRSRRQAVVAWLDLSNAFGSVPHATIRRAFVRAGVPRKVIEIWRSMYDDCTTRIRTAEGYTAPINIRSGVRQGCPLSPIAFDLAIDSVLRSAARVGAGYEVNGAKWAVLAYADDIALVSDTPEGMERLLAAVEREALSVGLRFNPAKCATLHIGGGGGGRVLPTEFAIQGQTVPRLAEGEPYRHLGVPTGFSVDQNPYSTIRGILEDLEKVNRSLLTPWQRVEITAVFLLPRLDFLLRGAAVEKSPLKTVDLTIRKYVKSWLNLPQRASAEVVYLPPNKGGCGLLPLADLADVLTIAHGYRMLTAGDAAVRELAWNSLRGVVQRRIGHAPDCDEIAAFLSGSLEGRLRGGGESSFWSRVRNAGRRQSERLSVRWKWARETEEMTVGCRGHRGTTVVVPPGARSQVITRLRSAVTFYYLDSLLRKPDQGKVFEVSSRDGVSNHFMRGGSFTRFADWRFIHRARLDVLPLNGARRWGEGDRRCRRCGGAAETLPHVLGHCGVYSAAIQLRYDAVLHRLWKTCRLPGEARVNQWVEGVHGELRELRPNLVVRHEQLKSVVICDAL